MFYSGELELRRKLNRDLGDVGWRILRYQRIIDPEKADYPVPSLSLVRPDTFAKQLHYLKKNCNVVSLPQLIDLILADEIIADKTVAITFDGGWMDTLAYAAPLLKKYEIHPTIFLPTGFANTNNYYWQDKVLFVLLALAAQKRVFKPFSFLNEKLRQRLIGASPDGEISIHYIEEIISVLEESSSENQCVGISTILAIGEAIGSTVPEVPCFMQLEDLRLLAGIGTTFGNQGHGRLNYEQISTELVIQDQQGSREFFEDTRLPFLPYFAPPQGGLNISVIPALVLSGIAAIFGPTSFLPNPGQDSQIPIYPRRIINQNNSPTIEQFAATLWL